MRKFIINVNGKSYEVEVEEVSGGSTQLSTSTARAAESASLPKAATVEMGEAPKPAQKHGGGATGSVKVNSPMPGSIWEIKVSPGDVVKKGQVVLVLEAMKMENDILAPQDGTIVSIPVAKGSSVNAGDLLFSMD